MLHKNSIHDVLENLRALILWVWDSYLPTYPQKGKYVKDRFPAKILDKGRSQKKPARSSTSINAENTININIYVSVCVYVNAIGKPCPI